jgi:hypothetical protein
MEIRLNMSDGVPVYRQIVNQVKYLMASGRLVAGQELDAHPGVGGAVGDQPEHRGACVCGIGAGRGGGEPAWIGDLRGGSGAPKVTESGGGGDLAAESGWPCWRMRTHLGMGIGELVKLVRDRHEALKRSERT